MNTTILTRKQVDNILAAAAEATIKAFEKENIVPDGLTISSIFLCGLASLVREDKISREAQAKMLTGYVEVLIAGSKLKDTDNFSD